MHSVEIIHHKKQNFSKNRIFSKWLTHAFDQNMYFFLELFSVKIRLEIMFINVLDTKKRTFSAIKNSIFLSPKNRIFPKGGMFNNVLHTKETFFGH